MLFRSIGNVPPPQVISGSGTKEDPWISPATELEVGDSFTTTTGGEGVGDIPYIPEEVLPPPPLPQDIPPLSEWISQFGPEEGRIKYNEAKRGLVTTTSDTPLPPIVRESVLTPPSVSEFSEQIISNSNADGIADLSISSDVVDFETVTKPTVPMCYAEDVAAQIIYAHKKTIDEANNAILKNMNSFIGDMQDMLGIEQQKPSDLLPGLEKGAIESTLNSL